MDQTNEHIVNRDGNPLGGKIWFSNNADDAHCWILSSNQHVEVSRSCTEMAGKAEGRHKKKYQHKSRYEKAEADIENVMHTIESLQNPYTYEKELINIALGQVALSEILKKLYFGNTWKSLQCF